MPIYKLEEKIKRINLETPDTNAISVINNAKTKNPKIEYGIEDNMLFVIDAQKQYCRKLPFVINGKTIKTKEKRADEIKIFAQSQAFDIYSGIHIFFSEEEKEKLKTENSECIMEKLTDITNGNELLKIIINTADSYNPAYIIETNNTQPHIVCSKIYRKNRNGEHIVVRGVVYPEALNDTSKWTYNVVKWDTLLASMILFNKKIGIKLLQSDINVFYDLNELNHNPQNNELYKTKSIIIDKDIRFEDLSEEFIAGFESIMADVNMKIIYVNTNILGFDSLSVLQKKYELMENESIKAFEEFVSKHNVGVIFYDNNEVRKRKYSNEKYLYYNYPDDPNLIGTILESGKVIKKGGLL